MALNDKNTYLHSVRSTVSRAGITAMTASIGRLIKAVMKLLGRPSGMMGVALITMRFMNNLWKF